MKRYVLLSVLALTAFVACAPKKEVSVQIRTAPEDLTVTMRNQSIGKAPQRIQVYSTEDLIDLSAKRDLEPAVEKRVRVLSDKEVEVTFQFNENASPMARSLGQHHIVVFSYGSDYSFDPGKATIKPMFIPLLQHQARILKTYFDYTNTSAYICGHTDATGSKTSNQTLSLDRAKAVADELVRWGVPRERLRVFGYGSDVAIASNSIPEGQAMNRRIEVILPQ
jgi:outer membrane protein OmpA-like peptidoglycan-associated protein